MELRLLGTLELRVDGRATKLGPQQQRCILAALAHDAGNRISTETIIDRVWGRSPPPTSRETVGKYVSGLRRIVARAGGAADVILGGRQRGYTLNLPPGSVDLHSFRQLLTEARAADADGRHDAAARLSGDALALWQGDAALPTLNGDWVETVRNQLDLDRLSATKLYARARLELGMHGALVGELSRLVDEHPYDESLVEYLMLALYRSGRRLDALDQFQFAHNRLYRDQGIELSQQLRTLQQRILSDDQSLHLRHQTTLITGPHPASDDASTTVAPRAPDPEDYPVEDREHLVAALLALDPIRDRRVRDAVVAEVEDELGEPLVLTRDPVDHRDVAHLVDACASTPGGLWVLCSVVGRSCQVEGQAEAVRALTDLVHRLAPVPLLEPQERRELVGLVTDLHCPGVVGLYRAAVGPAGRHLARAPTNLVGIVHDLEESTTLSGSAPPLLVFVEHLAEQVGEATGAALHGWVDRVAARLGKPAVGAITRMRSGAVSQARTEPSRAYLVVALQPDGIDAERYLLSIWLQYDDQEGDTIRRDDEPYSLAEIQAALDEVLTETPMVAGREDRELVVEFVLPRSLLSHPVDQWTFGARMAFPRRLGIWYPVVVRSLERMRSQAMHRFWRQKWDWLQANRDTPGEAFFWIHAAGELDPETLLSSLIMDPRRVCLVLPFPPPATPELGQDELAAGLHAGTPVMVWCRDRTNPGRFTGQLRALLEGGPLVELPGRALTLRQQAVARQGGQTGDHLGLHLSVLWDDPDRLPEPYVPLRAPAWRAPA